MWNVTREVLAGDIETWAGYLLGRNEYGIWLYIPARTPVHNAQGEQVDTLQARAQLVSEDKSWVAAWCEDGSTIACVTTAPRIDGRSIRYVDLGLHSWTDQNGRFVRADAAGYEEAVATGVVLADQDGSARAAFSDLERQMADRDEPFGQVGRRWFTGITRDELHFVAYDPRWPARFAAARDEIQPLLPSGSRVEHFGSTSVPGLSAKDCIDIAAVVPRYDQINAAIAALSSLGYQARPNAFNDRGHVFLRRLTGGQRSHHLHVYQEGHQNLLEALAFRDLLRSDPQARQRYQAVKRTLAEANPYDRSGYLAGKNEVAGELLRLALTRLRQDAEPVDRRGDARS